MDESDHSDWLLTDEDLDEATEALQRFLNGAAAARSRSTGNNRSSSSRRRELTRAVVARLPVEAHISSDDSSDDDDDDDVDVIVGGHSSRRPDEALLVDRSLSRLRAAHRFVRRAAAAFSNSFGGGGASAGGGGGGPSTSATLSPSREGGGEPDNISELLSDLEVSSEDVDDDDDDDDDNDNDNDNNDDDDNDNDDAEQDDEEEDEDDFTNTVVLPARIQTPRGDSGARSTSGEVARRPRTRAQTSRQLGAPSAADEDEASREGRAASGVGTGGGAGNDIIDQHRERDWALGVRLILPRSLLTRGRSSRQEETRRRSASRHRQPSSRAAGRSRVIIDAAEAGEDATDWDATMSDGGEAFFSDEATISESSMLENEVADQVEGVNEDASLAAISVPGLQTVRVLVEQMSSHDVARQVGPSLLEISSDEDTEEQRHEWRRQGLATARRQRVMLRRSTQPASSQQPRAQQSRTSDASGSGTGTGNSTSNDNGVSASNNNTGASNSNTNNETREDASSHNVSSRAARRQRILGDSQGPPKRSRLADDCESTKGSTASGGPKGLVAATNDDDIEDCGASSDNDDADEVNNKRTATCSICLDDIDGGGDHRLVVLKCGHCFGESCIKRWLMSDKRCCPMCNRPACLKDMRVVFLDCYRVGTSYELAEARKELDDLREREQQQSTKCKKLTVQVQELSGQNEILLKKIRALQRGIFFHGDSAYSQNSEHSSELLAARSFTKLSGNSKYMAYSHQMKLIAVSGRPTGPLFEGHVIEVCSLYDLKSRRAKCLHLQEVKDLDFQSWNPWLLTASLDGTGRISRVDNLSLQDMHKLDLGRKIWSCAWSQMNDRNFYLGLFDGSILEYDIRVPRDPVTALKGPSPDNLPIVSLKPFVIKGGNSDTYGVACSQLRCIVRLYTATGPSRYRTNDLVAGGNCFSLAYCNDKDSLLLTSRTPNGNGLTSITNELFTLSIQDDETRASVCSRFQSGGSSSVITKPTLSLSPSGNDLWACCLDDQAQTIQVFSCDDASLQMTLKTQDPKQQRFTQVEQITLPGRRSDYALLGLSQSGLSLYSRPD